MEFTEPEREKLGIYAPGKEPERGKKGNLGTRRERVNGVCVCEGCVCSFREWEYSFGIILFGIKQPSWAQFLIRLREEKFFSVLLCK